MSGREITFQEAVVLATRRAREVLGSLFPKSESDVFEDFVVRDKAFWLFFRNRKIIVPDVAEGIKSYKWAYAVGKHGMTLIVADNLESREQLDDQVEKLSLHFAKRDI